MLNFHTLLVRKRLSLLAKKIRGACVEGGAVLSRAERVAAVQDMVHRRQSSPGMPLAGMHTWLVQWMRWCLLSMLLVGSGAVMAANVDLSVSSYDWTPDNVYNGAVVDFTVKVSNSGISGNAAAGATLEVPIPANMEYQAASWTLPGGTCSPTAGKLVCTLPALAAQADVSLKFKAKAVQPAAMDSAVVVTVAAGDTESNPANNTSRKTITAQEGTDLYFVSHVASKNPVLAGEALNFTLVVGNKGPNDAKKMSVSLNLPPDVDYGSASASGTGWTCGAPGGTPRRITCDWTGATVPVGQAASPITLTGKALNLAGDSTITHTASVSVPAGALSGDPIATNNEAVAVVVKVTPATNLVGKATMESSKTQTPVFVKSDPGFMILQVQNQGPAAATGVKVTGQVPVGFLIGTMPAGCALSGRTVTCDVGALQPNTLSNSFKIPLTSGPDNASSTGATEATATPSRAGPVDGQNTQGTGPWSVVNDYANLELTKSKGPATPKTNNVNEPVKQGDMILSTITATNSNTSTSAVGGTLSITDLLLSPYEKYDHVDAPWSCTEAAEGANRKLTCTYTLPAGSGIAVGAQAPVLKIYTRVDLTGLPVGQTHAELGNQACSVASPDQTPPAKATECKGASIIAGTVQADLQIAKTVSMSTVPVTTSNYSYTLTVKNNNAQTQDATQGLVDEYVVEDDLKGFYVDVSGLKTSIAVVANPVVDASAGESCVVDGARKLKCTLKSLPAQETRSITITLQRPFATDGAAKTNTATVFAPHVVDSTPSNNTASVPVTLAPVADVSVTALAPTQGSLQVGVKTEVTVSIKNLGANAAADIQVVIPIPAGLVLDLASIVNPAGMKCTAASSAGPLTCVGNAGMTLNANQALQPRFSVTPDYSLQGKSAAFNASISTSTFDSNASNDNHASTLAVLNPQLDLSVKLTEAHGYKLSPTSAATKYDPVGFEDDIKYVAVLTNTGPSLASEFSFEIDLAPPSAFGALFIGIMPATLADVTAAGISATGSFVSLSNLTCTPSGLKLTCRLDSGLAQSQLAANASTAVVITYKTTGSTAPKGSITYAASAKVTSKEVTGGFEAPPANNAVTETTTVFPKTDLAIAKSVSKPLVDLNEPFTYTLTVTNKGPSTAYSFRVTDDLPAGLMLDSATSIPRGILDCSTGAQPGSYGQLVCDVNLDAVGGLADRASVALTVPVRAAYPKDGKSFPAFSPIKISNIGKVFPTSSLDPNDANQSQPADVAVRKNSLAGVTYSDDDANQAFTAGEGIANVTVTLKGTDAYGHEFGVGNNEYPALTVKTDAQGNFLFDKLPPGNWTIVETQPTGYFDSLEKLGTAGGSKPADTCDGTLNCSASAASNTISGIVLPTAVETAATAYAFEELKPAQIKGWVFADSNNDGKLDAQEAKISEASTIVLTGKAYNGQALSAFGVGLSKQSNVSGYSFTQLPPSNSTGYTVQQTTQPSGYLNGKTGVQPETDAHNTLGVVAGPDAYSNQIEQIVLRSAGVASGNNFGELKPASISGYAFIDGNKNAFRDAVDSSGVTGMTVTLTGTDDKGPLSSSVVYTGTIGAYSFADLRPGTYQVAIAPMSGMNHVGAQIGDKGGQSGAASGPSLGQGVANEKLITAIALVAGDKGLNYNFGQSGEGLSGKVYVDLNGNGQWDSNEPGIPDVKIALSGMNKDGRDICEVISPKPCTTTTGTDGGYSFVALPQAGAAGYTLTEQAQTDVPLNRYADGLETVGSLGGTAGNDVISGIPLKAAFGSNYNFGEKGIDLPGRVFVDGNANGTPDGGEPGLPNVTITLSGTTVDDQDVCTVLSAQGRSCTLQTGPDGKFNFPGLPAGDYTLTETQPKDYSTSSNTPGNAGGQGSDAPNGDSKFTGIKLTPSTPKVTEYLFAEKTGGLSGYVYHDKNGNGLRDSAGDPAIAGVTIKLTGTTKQGDPVSLTTTTLANGYYSFDGLHNGTYTVTETQPADWLDGKTSKGLVGGSECGTCVNSASNAIAAIEFVADKAYTEFNFGEVKSTRISGAVYHDVNEDGHLNPNEGLAGVTVTLTGTDDQGNPVTKTVTTGPDGKYSFPDLRPSDSKGYTITETQPADIGDFTSSGGQPGTVNGQPAGSSTLPNVITGVVLKSAESGEDYNFRDKASSLSGTVYRDDNDNGLLDGAERGLPGVTVTLTGTSQSGQPISMTTTTGADGNYHFVGLPAGTYQLVETQPAGMLDGKETAGTKGGTVNSSQFCDAASCNTIADIKLSQAENATGYLFGERGGSLSGAVYADLNNSGTKDANEPGLAGVKVSLSGTTAMGEDICALRGAAFCTVVTDASGNYKFEGVPPGVYQLVKSQNQVNELFSGKYGDGKETAGVAGGVLENRYFGTQPGYNSIQKISLTAETIAANAGNIGGYLFGVVPAAGAQNRIPPTVSGYVYMDQTHDRVRDPMNTDGQAGWTATLTASTGQQICQVVTLANGFYQFDNLSCPEQYRTTGLPSSADLGGATFSIFFSKDGNVLPSMASSGDKIGEAGAGRITNLTLKNTDVLVEQNLPLDPEGVVYDAVTRKPVAGAVIGITFTGAGLFDPSTHLVGGASFQNQTTGTDGRYSFILQNDYPSGEYVLTIQSAPPAYLPGPSVMIPACVNTLNVAMLPGGLPALMQAQRNAPGLAQTLHDPLACPATPAGFANTAPFTLQQQSTQYYLRFAINRGASSEILNNHIPVDPVLAGGALLVTKTTPKVNVAKGDLVPYSITATNMSGGALANVRVRDMLPPGFRYRKGSATWNKLPVEPEVNGRELTWPNQNFATNEKKSYQLLLTVGAGVGEGEYVNQAWAINSLVSERISNVATAAVRVVPDPTFDCSDLIGKVFDDKNANGYQDQGEIGIPNVRVVTARGLLVTTDADGRFHVACAAIPQADRGSNFVMKLDERTLPSGYRMTTENPRDVRVTRGKMVKLNFGAAVHKVLRLEVDARAFAPDAQLLSEQWNSQVEQLLAQLAERPTVLRIAYRMTGEGKDVAAQRLKALTQRIHDGYAQRAQQQKKREDDTPPLVIETESFEQNKAEGVR